MARWALDDEADYVVVGTGAGGATAGRVLTESGRSVLFLEEGPWLETSERTVDMLNALTSSMRDAGAQATTGWNPIPLLQGRCVGGSTAVNSGLIWRMPSSVADEWTVRHGLGELVDEDRLHDAYECIEEDLDVAPVRFDRVGGNGTKLAHACRVLGLPGQLALRNGASCQGESRCLQGCPHQARQSMDVSYIPRALRRGARLHARCRVGRVRFERGRAVAVEGERLEQGRVVGRIRARARRAVILSAGALHTPLILWRSGVRAHVGERFQCHPGVSVVGRFPDRVGMVGGATQAYEVPMPARGFKLESLSLPPEMLAARIPGAGKLWQQRIGELDHYAQWAGILRMRALGTVRPGWSMPVVRYEPNADDLALAHYVVALLASMMFAAGAIEVYPDLGSVPQVLRSLEEVETLRQTTLSRSDFQFVTSHLFGTASAGSDPRRAVVDPQLRTYAARDLYVMDASVFPTNLGVNPQHSIMAVTYLAASRLADRESHA